MRITEQYLAPFTVTLLLTSSLGFADNSNTSSNDSSNVVIEEMTVTAQRRDESQQQVPIAVSAFQEDDIELSGIRSFNDLSFQTPGFNLSNFNSSTPQLYIRGIGSNTSGAADDSSVALFIDDVYIARPGAFNTDVFGIETIEVLRGPQGTLYGKNVVGGVIKLNSKKPSDEFAASIGLDVGDYGRNDAQLFINGPLTDQVFANVALSQQRKEGYVENTVTGDDERDVDSLSLRGSLLMHVNSDLEVIFRADRAKIRENGSGRILDGDLFFGLPAPSLGDLYKKDSPLAGGTDRDSEGVSITANYQQSDWVWTSITAYRDDEYTFEEDILPTQLIRTLVNSVDEQAAQFSQEFRLSGSLWNNHHATSGIYFLQEKVDRLEIYDMRELAVVAGVPDFLAVNEINAFDASNETTSYAVFHQSDIQLTDQWGISIGGRYTEETKTFETCATGSNFLGFELLIAPYCDVNEEESWDDFTTKFAVQFQPNDDMMLYLSYTEGFKSGSFHSLADSEAAATTSVEPEYATQYEFGFKSMLLDRRLRLNAALFTIDYEDLQVFISDGASTYVDNAAQATSKGVELEFEWLLTAELSLVGGYSYLDATYDEFITSTSQDVTGNDLLRAPQNNYHLAVSYNQYYENLGYVVGRVDYSVHDDMFFDPANSEAARVHGYELVNARLQFESLNESWVLALWGRNLGDKEYELFRFPLLTSQSVVPGEPRTVGLTVQYHIR